LADHNAHVWQHPQLRSSGKLFDKSLAVVRIERYSEATRLRRRRMKRLLLPLSAITAAMMILPISASAEWFADLYLGSAFTQKHDVETSVLGITATIQDVTFDSSFAVGGRGGYWFESGPLRSFGLDLGLGVDVSHFSPDISKQTRTTCVLGFCGGAQFA